NGPAASTPPATCEIPASTITSSGVSDRVLYSRMAEGKSENFKQRLNGVIVERKRPRIHLSDLHTDILSRIISLLPLKEAARTSVLSNHWKNIWCSQENLVPMNFKGFWNLQKLKLVYTNVSDEDMQTLVSNCKFLEYLGIINCGMLTRLRTSHPFNQLKHLQVESCTMLQEIELNFGLTKLEYEGPLIPLAPPGPLLMTNVWMKLSDMHAALEYIFTKLPSTLPRLEMLTVNCSELKRTTLPEKTVKFMYLKHLRLELTFCVRTRKADMFDFACLLEAAPLLETLELH
ncbi:hypothetical protein E2562_035512, partial [Oryza meyeriana var. granulata]